MSTKPPKSQTKTNKIRLEKQLPTKCRVPDEELQENLLKMSLKEEINITLNTTIINDHEIDSSTTNEDIQSCTPTEYNEEDRLFHLNFLHQSQLIAHKQPNKYKNGTRKSLSFSNERMREIERVNRILLQKILTKNSAYRHGESPYRTSSSQSSETSTRTSSAAVNRKKQQRQIDNDNQILRKKLEKIARRK